VSELANPGGQLFHRPLGVHAITSAHYLVRCPPTFTGPMRVPSSAGIRRKVCGHPDGKVVLRKCLTDCSYCLAAH
jgi:hypothetical protein